MKSQCKRIGFGVFSLTMLVLFCAGQAGAFPPDGIGTARDNVSGNGRASDALDLLDGDNQGTDLANDVRNENAGQAGNPSGGTALSAGGSGGALGHIPDNGHTGNALDVLEGIEGGLIGFDLAEGLRNEHAGVNGPANLPTTLGIPELPDNDHTGRALDVLEQIELGILGLDLATGVRNEHAGDAGGLGATGLDLSSGGLSTTHAPEPVSVALMALGLGGLLLRRKRR